MNKTSMQTDVVVVGAGPAGSVAAQRLAAGGARVVLLEQAVFPRPKPCGDAVTAQGLEVIERLGLSGWAEQFPACREIRFTSPRSQVIDTHLGREDGAAAGRMIPRRLLDAKLVELAVQAGARLMEGVNVQSVALNGRTAAVSAHLEVEASLVILAEGARAPLAHRLGLVSESPQLLALQQYLAGDQGPAGRMEVHFQEAMLPGWSWIFPLGDGRANLGGWTFAGRVMKRRLAFQEEFKLFYRSGKTGSGRLAGASPSGPLASAPLRTRLGGTRTHTARLLVAGDAAGLANPMTGMGIASAMRSGELAAKTGLKALASGDFSAAGLAGYSRALDAEYKMEQKAALFMRGVFSNVALLELVFGRLQTRPDLARLFAEIFLGSQSAREALKPGSFLKLVV